MKSKLHLDYSVSWLCVLRKRENHRLQGGSPKQIQIPRKKGEIIKKRRDKSHF